MQFIPVTYKGPPSQQDWTPNDRQLDFVLHSFILASQQQYDISWSRRILNILPYDISDNRASILDERDAKLTQDIKEIKALLAGAQRLLQRFDESGTGLLNWFPGVLRHLLQTRVVGPSPTIPIPLSSSTSGSRQDTNHTPQFEQDVVLNVLVMLEILDWTAEALNDASMRAGRRGRNPMSEAARKRIVQGELIRISVSSEDLRDILEQELADLSTYREQLSRSDDGTLSTSDSWDSDEDAISTYAHPLLDRSIPSTEARPLRDFDPFLTYRTLVPSVLHHSRQRAHSFPLALGLLARCVIKGTITRSSLPKRARSLDARNV
ncbi:hypothetical protein DFH11DRAFT_222346 [Phellopilus nigrolimitatus]|nr:hypothetical protein DFH11DRAFT_222346 [Phellopilus nigrolimitatus]